MHFLSRYQLVPLVLGLLALLSGCGSGDAASRAGETAVPPQVQEAALKKYGWFLDENAQALVIWTRKLAGQIAKGNLPRAQSRYATARAQYAQIEQAAQAFDQLDSEINAHEGDRHGDQFEGFHRIEKGLFADRSLRGLRPVAKKLLRNVKTLHHELRTSPLPPELIVEEASGLVRELATSKVRGAEEPYAHIDLVDIAGNLEGLEEAFAAVRSDLAHRDLNLTENIEVAFADAYVALAKWGSRASEPQVRPAAAGVHFLPFRDLSQAEVSLLSDRAEALRRFLERVPERIQPQSP